MKFQRSAATAFVVLVGIAIAFGSGCPTEPSAGPDESWTFGAPDTTVDTDAAECSDDDDCREGYVCDPNDECQVNLCLKQPPICPPEQRCIPLIGECSLPECEGPNECLQGKLCVETHCVLKKNACGEDGCPEGQTCHYEADTLTAECSK